MTPPKVKPKPAKVKPVKESDSVKALRLIDEAEKNLEAALVIVLKLDPHGEFEDIYSDDIESLRSSLFARLGEEQYRIQSKETKT